jgi:hypothetical protein
MLRVIFASALTSVNNTQDDVASFPFFDAIVSVTIALLCIPRTQARSG